MCTPGSPGIPESPGSPGSPGSQEIPDAEETSYFDSSYTPIQYLYDMVQKNKIGLLRRELKNHPEWHPDMAQLIAMQENLCYLIDDLSPDATTHLDNSVLQSAAIANNMVMLNWLWENGNANLIHWREALEHVFEYDASASVHFAITKIGPDFYKIIIETGAFWVALSHGCISIVSLLIDLKFLPRWDDPVSRLNLIMRATECGLPKILELLLTRGLIDEDDLKTNRNEICARSVVNGYLDICVWMSRKGWLIDRWINLESCYHHPRLAMHQARELGWNNYMGYLSRRLGYQWEDIDRFYTFLQLLMSDDRPENLTEEQRQMLRYDSWVIAIRAAQYDNVSLFNFLIRHGMTDKDWSQAAISLYNISSIGPNVMYLLKEIGYNTNIITREANLPLHYFILFLEQQVS
jgi:hypothetical protein